MNARPIGVALLVAGLIASGFAVESYRSIKQLELSQQKQAVEDLRKARLSGSSEYYDLKSQQKEATELLRYYGSAGGLLVLVGIGVFAAGGSRRPESNQS